MPLLDWIVDSLEKPAVPISSAEVLKVLGLTGQSAAGVEVTVQSALGHTPLWRGLNLLSSDVAKIPIDVFRRDAGGNRQRLRDHPVSRLLRQRPNGAMTPFRWKKVMMFHALLRGNGYSAILRNGAHQPQALLLLEPTPGTVPIVDGRGELWYVTTINETQRRLKAEDVIHVPGLSYDGLEGLDVLAIMADALGLGIAERRHAGRYFSRGTATPGFLMTPRSLDDKELAKIRANWQRMQVGVDRAYEIAVLHGGWDFKPLGIDPEKSQLVQSREFSIVEVANVLGVPAHKLGDARMRSYASIEAENADYLATSLDPWLCTIEEEAARTLLTDEEREQDDIYIEFNRRAVLRIDYATRIDGYRKLREMGVLSANQTCEAENLPSQGPKGEQYFIPANWAVVGEDGLPISPGPWQRRRPAYSAKVLDAHRALLLDRAGRVVDFEVRKVQEAARRQSNFLAWMDRFYQQHAAKLQETFAPIMLACCAALGRQRQDGLFRLSRAIQGHIQESREGLLAAAQGNRKADFPEAIRALTAGWSARAEVLVRAILRKAIGLEKDPS